MNIRERAEGVVGRKPADMIPAAFEAKIRMIENYIRDRNPTDEDLEKLKKRIRRDMKAKPEIKPVDSLVLRLRDGGDVLRNEAADEIVRLNAELTFAKKCFDAVRSQLERIQTKREAEDLEKKLSGLKKERAE